MLKGLSVCQMFQQHVLYYVMRILICKWQACFDFARIVGLVIDDVVLYQPLIQSISTILSEDKQGLLVFRNVSYDSSIGGCLNMLYSICCDDVVKLTQELERRDPLRIWILSRTKDRRSMKKL